MRPAFPFHLDGGMVVNGNEDPFMISDAKDFRGVSGSDANGNKATNIVGFDGSDLLKRCTNPNCDQPIKPRAAGFGESGRCTDRLKRYRRDQAQCIICRSQK